MLEVLCRDGISLFTAWDIKNEFVDFFHKLFIKVNHARFLPSNVDWNTT